MDETNVMFSTSEEAERLYHYDAESCARDDWLDSGREAPIRVYAWRRKVITDDDVKRVADHVVEATEEWLTEGEEWTDPEEGHDLRSEFAAALRSVVRQHLPREHVWSCDRAPELDVTIAPPSVKEGAE